jgi:rhodanese-related sulfurtransferase
MSNFIKDTNLVELLQNKSDEVLVVDVRDDDFTGNKIKGAQNFPSKRYLSLLKNL